MISVLSEPQHRQRLSFTWSQLCVVMLLVVGLSLRFTNVDKKVYGDAETITSLRITGYPQSAIIARVFNGNEMGIHEVQSYRSINPDSSVLSVLLSLVAQDPKHPPLYYGLVRLWASLCGDSVKMVRSFSAFVSLLVFPCLYWFCLELFGSRRVAGVATALMAVSPFHVLYAQEARQYSLWTVIIVLSSAALLRALRRHTRSSWGVYATTVALGLYTHTFFGFVIFAHAVYVAGNHSEQIKRTGRCCPKPVIAYGVTTLIGVLLFAPWILLAYTVGSPHLSAELLGRVEWLTREIPFFHLAAWWGIGLSAVFFDVDGALTFQWANMGNLLIQAIRLPVLLLIGYALYFLCRRTERRVWLFVVALIVGPIVTLVLPDLIFGGRRSLPARYWIPCYVGLQLAMAYLLATQSDSPKLMQRRLWQGIMGLLITGGVMSCLVSARAETWWNKGASSYTALQAARVVNHAPRPLVISTLQGTSVSNLLSQSSAFAPHVRLRLVTGQQGLSLPDGFSDVFLLDPAGHLRRRLAEEKLHTGKALHVVGDLWRLATAADSDTNSLR